MNAPLLTVTRFVPTGDDGELVRKTHVRRNNPSLEVAAGRNQRVREMFLGKRPSEALLKSAKEEAAANAKRVARDIVKGESVKRVSDAHAAAVSGSK